MSLSSLPPPFFCLFFRLLIRLSFFIHVILFFSFSQNHIPKNPRLGQRSISQTLTHTQANKQTHNGEAYTNQFIFGIPNSFVYHRSLSTKVHKGERTALVTPMWDILKHGYIHPQVLDASSGSSSKKKGLTYLLSYLFQYAKEKFMINDMFIYSCILRELYTYLSIHLLHYTQKTEYCTY